MHNRALFEILIHLKLVWLLITHPKDQSDYYPLIPKKKLSHCNKISNKQENKKNDKINQEEILHLKNMVDVCNQGNTYLIKEITLEKHG